MAFKKTWRSFKKNAGKVARHALRSVAEGAKMAATARYANPNGLKNLASDVMTLKKIINAEKKHIVQTNAQAAGYGLAQLRGATGSGHYTIDATPIVSQGVTGSTRNGNSIKLCSSNFKFQLRQQANCANRVNVKAFLLFNDRAPQTITGGYTDTSVAPDLLQVNQWIFASDAASIYDYNSDYNIDRIGQWKILRKIKFAVPTDTYSGATTQKEFRFGMKYKNVHIKYDNDTNTIARGQLALLLVADTGNSDGTTASTLTGALVPGTSTGVTFRYSIDHYFYDN